MLTAAISKGCVHGIKKFTFPVYRKLWTVKKSSAFNRTAISETIENGKKAFVTEVLHTKGMPKWILRTHLSRRRPI